MQANLLPQQTNSLLIGIVRDFFAAQDYENIQRSSNELIEDARN